MPSSPTDETLPDYLARTNDEFVKATRQMSPRMMRELLEQLGPELDALWATRDLEGPADLDVSWAATDIGCPAWLDIAREYTEFWVHQQQVRDAVAVLGADDSALMRPVLATFARALPYALRSEERPEGTVVKLEVTGPAGGRWFATMHEGRWGLTSAGEEPAAEVCMDQDAFWRLATCGIDVEAARGRADLSGDPALGAAATTLLAVVA